jgi:NADPH-dependent 2,4-dienoyl-CoA reductase/sulfur reductase-like enzyme
VVLHMKSGIKQIKGEDGKASAVILEDGTEIKADLVIIGAGVTPNTAFL